tara:strand:+ start:459 stop:635 length:177 start_codon:yes stop_codon:yes gene_type:complete
MTPEDYAKFPQEYKEIMKKESRLLTKRQIEILDGAELKSHEGMVFGQMYAEWKERKYD